MGFCTKMSLVLPCEGVFRKRQGRTGTAQRKPRIMYGAGMFPSVLELASVNKLTAVNCRDPVGLAMTSGELYLVIARSAATWQSHAGTTECVRICSPVLSAAYADGTPSRRALRGRTRHHRRARRPRRAGAGTTKCAQAYSLRLPRSVCATIPK